VTRSLWRVCNQKNSTAYENRSELFPRVDVVRGSRYVIVSNKNETNHSLTSRGVVIAGFNSSGRTGSIRYRAPVNISRTYGSRSFKRIFYSDARALPRPCGIYGAHNDVESASYNNYVTHTRAREDVIR